MQELEATWGRSARIYWAWAWRGALLCGLSGLVTGFVSGFAFAIAGHPEWIQRWWFGYLGMPVWIFLMIWMLRYVLRKKRFKEFRIGLVPLDPPAGA